MKNFKVCIALFIYIILASCSRPSYNIVQNSFQSGISFSAEDKILISPNNVELQRYLANLPVKTIDVAHNLLYIPNDRLVYQPEPEVFYLIKTTTDYKFYVSSKVRNTRNEISSIDVLPSNKDEKSNAYVDIRIYDISKMGEIVFEKSCRASNTKKKNRKLDVLNKNSAGLSLKCKEKILENFVQKSLKLKNNLSK